MRHPGHTREGLLRGIRIHADDHAGARDAGALNDIQADPTQAEDHGRGAGLHACREQDRAEAGGAGAAQATHDVHRRKR